MKELTSSKQISTSHHENFTQGGGIMWFYKVCKLATIITISSLVTFAGIAVAEDYPTKPVKLIIPFTEGSATDFIGRTVAKKLSEIWNQPVEVENHPGAGGTVGASVVAKAPADGYTLLEYSSAYTVSPSLHKNLPYNPTKDFVDIAPLVAQPLTLVVGTSSGLKSISEVIAKAKANPGEIKFGTPGIGSAAHLPAEQFKIKAGIDVVHMPFKGGPETIKATKNGTVLYSCLPLVLALKGGKDGKLKTLAVTTAKRSKALPDVPTLAEVGFPDIDSSVWWGLWAPAGIPDSIAKKLKKDIAKVLAAPEIIEKFKNRKLEPMSMTSAEFKQFVRKEMEIVKNIVKQAGIEPK
jgi:tripartite-type tricarboxylate transporter receptor subunit TctC